MAKTSLELIAGPSGVHTLPPPLRAPSRSFAAPLAISALALALSVAWGWYGSTKYDRGMNQLDELQLERASLALKLVTDGARSSIEAQARTLADDARVREPLATPGIDDATLLDVISDLKGSTGASIVALLSATGTVRVVNGADAMKGLDLSSSSLMNPGEKGVASGTWLLPDRMAVVAVAPIRLGNALTAHVLVGRDLGAAALALVSAATGVSGAISVQEKIVAATMEEKSLALIDAARLEPDHAAAVDGGRYLARVERIDAARGGKVAWFVPRHHAQQAMSFGFEVWWSPAALVLFGTLLWWGLEYRRTRPEKGN